MLPESDRHKFRIKSELTICCSYWVYERLLPRVPNKNSVHILNLVHNIKSVRFDRLNLGKLGVVAFGVYLRVIMTRDSMQARDEMSSSIRCRFRPNSTMELIHSPNPGRHWSRWRTSPLQNVTRSSSAWILQKIKPIDIKKTFNWFSCW